MNIINLTPHALTIYRSTNDPDPLIVPSSGTVARCKVERKPYPAFGSDLIPYFETVFGEVENLPPTDGQNNFVVSAIVLNALGGTRGDVFCPGEAIRDEAGRVIGCIGLSR